MTDSSEWPEADAVMPRVLRDSQHATSLRPLACWYLPQCPSAAPGARLSRALPLPISKSVADACVASCRTHVQGSEAAALRTRNGVGPSCACSRRGGSRYLLGQRSEDVRLRGSLFHAFSLSQLAQRKPTHSTAKIVIRHTPRLTFAAGGPADG